MSYEELMKFALEHYRNGGDGVYECWDEQTYNEYVSEYGQITKEIALEMFQDHKAIFEEYQATAW